MDKIKKQLNFWRCAAILELIALIVIGVVFSSGSGINTAPAPTAPTAVETTAEPAAEALLPRCG